MKRAILLDETDEDLVANLIYADRKHLGLRESFTLARAIVEKLNDRLIKATDFCKEEKSMVRPELIDFTAEVTNVINRLIEQVHTEGGASDSRKKEAIAKIVELHTQPTLASDDIQAAARKGAGLE